jgi:class 3 adenylate cyclase
MLSCPHCAFENLSTATFCVNCGRELKGESALTRQAPPGTPARVQAERRFATMLFADLSGFTALSEMLDPEAVRDIINLCFDRLVPIVEAHQGVVDQFVGDAIVALYGAPVAHEDDPAQACRTALDMMDAIEQINRERGLNLGLHIGINSGTVISGGVGSRGRQQYSVLGDAVNMAARLEDAAERGEIFVGAATVQLTHEQFEFVEHGEMSLKGKSEPQPVYQLVGARQAVRGHRPVHTLTPMFGRDRELVLLQHITREMQSAPGLRIVSILGEAGLGKSRLVQEWRDAVHDSAASDIPFLVASCAPDSNLRAYAFLAEIAHALSSVQKDAEENALLAFLLGGVETPSRVSGDLDASALQAQYVNALCKMLVHPARRAALVLVCEDVHWADAPSCQVLQRVLATLSETHILFCVTLRPERETPGWAFMETIEELPDAAAVRLHLTPLSENDAQALLSNLAPGTLPAEVEQLVLSHAEGNPLFVEELARMLIERGDLKRQGEEWTLTRELVALDVPNTLQGVLMARVDQLPPDARKLLQLASVLGREFPLEVVERVLSALPQTD